MIKPHQENTIARVVPCEDCPPELERAIQIGFELCKILARQGLWANAERAFCAVRETCLEFQPKTLDPFEVLIADTPEISAQLRNQLESIGVVYVGQVANVPHRELKRLRIGPVGRRQLKGVCRRYGVEIKL